MDQERKKSCYENKDKGSRIQELFDGKELLLRVNSLWLKLLRFRIWMGKRQEIINLSNKHVIKRAQRLFHLLLNVTPLLFQSCILCCFQTCFTSKCSSFSKTFLKVRDLQPRTYPLTPKIRWKRIEKSATVTRIKTRVPGFKNYWSCEPQSFSFPKLLIRNQHVLGWDQREL